MLNRHDAAELHGEILRLYHVLLNGISALEISRSNADSNFLILHGALRELRVTAEACRLAGFDHDGQQPSTRASRRLVRRRDAADDELPVIGDGLDDL